MSLSGFESNKGVKILQVGKQNIRLHLQGLPFSKFRQIFFFFFCIRKYKKIVFNIYLAVNHGNFV